MKLKESTASMTARAGKEDEVGGVEEVGAGLVEHGAPGGGGRRDAQAEEGESGFGEDGARHAHGGLDDQRLEDVGQDVANEQAEVRSAERTGGFDELALADCHDLGSHEPGVADPAGDGEGENEVEEAGTEEGYEGDGEQDARERKEGVGDVGVQDDVGDAAVEAGETACDEAEGERDAHDGDRDHQRDARSEEGAGEDVAAELVGAEGVSSSGCGEAVVSGRAERDCARPRPAQRWRRGQRRQAR